jgi:hypothetical protein
MNVWGGSVNGGAASLMPSTGIGVGTVDPGLVQDVAAGIAGMHFPAGSDAVNSSGCPTGTGKTPRPCAGASQGGCPSGNAKTDSWSLTNSWGFRFAKGAAIAKAKDVAKGWIRINAAIATGGGSEIVLAAYNGVTALDEGYQRDGVVGAIEDHLTQSIPILGMYDMGENLYLAVQKGDPEELGAAALPVFEAAVGMVAGAKLAASARAIQEHHIATVKNLTSSARGGPWTPRFAEVFDRAGMSMEDAANRVPVPGHKGPHPQAYHEHVFERLNGATRGLSGVPAESALRGELAGLRSQILLEGSFLNGLVTKK